MIDIPAFEDILHEGRERAAWIIINLLDRPHRRRGHRILAIEDKGSGAAP
jgi:hypothetical protein